MQESAVNILRIGARKAFGIRWHGEDLPSGATISSATQSVTPSGIATIEDPIVNAAADGIYFWATGITEGDCVVTITATRSDGEILIEDYGIEVPDKTLSDSALATIDEVRRFLGIKAGSTVEANAKLVYVIEAVSATMAGSVDCLFVAEEEIEETKDGNGMSYLHLDNWPVTDVDSVVEDGVTLNEDSDFYVDYANGILEKPRGYKWTTSRRGVVVTYDAGYEAVPADVKLAAIVESARAYSALDKQMFGESSRTQEGEAITINTDELLPATLATLARYLRVRI